MKRIILTCAIFSALLTLWTVMSEGVGNNAILSAIITVGLFTYGWHFHRLIKINWLNVVICTAVACFIGLVFFLAIYGNTDTTTYREEAALILGCGIRGETASASLQKRLDKTVVYAQKNPNALIVVTGGQGPNEDITEALAMKRYLVSKGVPSDSIILEDKALSTYENMLFSKDLLKRYFPDGYTAVVITSDFHMYRSSRFAAQLGISVTRLHAGTPWYKIPGSYIRESAAVVKQWLLRR